LKVPGDIMCGRDEAAEDDRPKAALEQIADDLDEPRELAILLRPGKRAGSVAKDFEPAPVVIDADALRLVHRPGGRVIGQLFVPEQIEHLGSISVVDLFNSLALFLTISVSAELANTVAEHHRCCVRTRQHRTQDRNRCPMPHTLLRWPQTARILD